MQRTTSVATQNTFSDAAGLCRSASDPGNAWLPLPSESMSTSSRAARAALQALFEPSSPVFTAAAEIELPTNLDACIEDEAGQFTEAPLYRWFAGVDDRGVVHFFKFQRGLSLSQWHEQLSRQRLVSVRGPYRTLDKAKLPVPA